MQAYQANLRDWSAACAVGWAHIATTAYWDRFSVGDTPLTECGCRAAWRYPFWLIFILQEKELARGGQARLDALVNVGKVSSRRRGGPARATGAKRVCALSRTPADRWRYAYLWQQSKQPNI